MKKVLFPILLAAVLVLAVFYGFIRKIAFVYRTGSLQIKSNNKSI